jgi:hypothetical protein
MQPGAMEQCLKLCLKEVGGVQIKTWHKASCHCGRVELILHLPNGVCEPRRCNCSICRRKGAVVGSVLLKDLEVVKGAEDLRCYQFNTQTAKHYFCSYCGIYTHHQRRSNPHEYGYNVGCLEGVDPFEIPRVPVADGVSHPADRHTDAECT